MRTTIDAVVDLREPLPRIVRARTSYLLGDNTVRATLEASRQPDRPVHNAPDGNPEV